jgi:hypothetical protein
VGMDTLTRLLAIQSELDWLDYKRQCNLSSTRGLVEFAKDVAAMMITGGYILVGADDGGQPAGDVEHLELFDPSVLHAKLTKYLPRPFEIRSAVHHYRGQSYALIYVVPHIDGFCIFEHNGAYADGKNQTIVFRAGDVFARHGTRSERWNQRDIAVIRERLLADTDRGHDQQAEAIKLVENVGKDLANSDLWLIMALVPEHRLADAAMISPETAQQFLRDQQVAQTLIKDISRKADAYRRPGGVLVRGVGAYSELLPGWQLTLYDAGESVGAFVLAQQDFGRRGEKSWRGMPECADGSQVIPARRDEIEIRLLTLLDVLTAYATHVGARGKALVMTILHARQSPATIALFEERFDDGGQRQGWRTAPANALMGYGAGLILEADALTPVVHRVRLADMRDAKIRLRAAHHLAADLLASFGIDQPSILTAEGTLDHHGAATDHQQMVYQHAQDLGLPVGPISPRQRL